MRIGFITLGNQLCTQMKTLINKNLILLGVIFAHKLHGLCAKGQCKTGCKNNQEYGME